MTKIGTMIRQASFVGASVFDGLRKEHHARTPDQAADAHQHIQRHAHGQHVAAGMSGEERG